MENEEKKELKKGFYIPAIIVCGAQVGTSGDNSVIGMAMGEFISELGASMDEIQLANIMYSLVAGALMVFGGMLGIAKGFKKVFLFGAFFACLGEVITILSPNIMVISYGGRLVTGFGAALMVPSILGIIVSLYEGKARAIAFGGVGAATGLAAVIMPVLAGFMMDHFGFRIAISMMAIWFLVVFIAGIRYIPNIKANSLRVDYVGTILIALGLVLFIIGCSKISVWGLLAPLDPPFTLFGLSPALFLVFAGVLVVALTMIVEKNIELKTGSALIPQSFIRTPQVRDGLYVTGLIFAVFGAVFFINVSWIIVVAGKSGVMTGVAMAVLAFPMIVLSICVPRYFFHISPRKVVYIGVLTCLVGAVLSGLSLQTDGYNGPLMYLGLAFFGFGAGCLSAQSAMIVSTALNERDAAQSGGIQCSTRNIWQAGAVAIIGSVMLYSCTFVYKNEIKEQKANSVLVKYVESQSVFGFMSNKELLNMLKSAKIEDEASKELALKIYKDSRLKAAYYAFFALVIVILLHVPGMSAVPSVGWNKLKKEK